MAFGHPHKEITGFDKGIDYTGPATIFFITSLQSVSTAGRGTVLSRGVPAFFYKINCEEIVDSVFDRIRGCPRPNLV